ncbi:MAG: hypothetical protein KJZ84_09660 [Bryobacteraceae bacterium]|nr:hypothetical protein [Bryobacteraceae bacterium]
MRFLILLPLWTLATAAQPAPPDPTLDTSGLPVWVNFIPKPAPEPWRMPTGEERLVRYAKETFNGTPLLAAGMGSAVSFGLGTPEEWPQDFKHYTKRFANNAAQHYIRSTAIHGLAAVLREDNTYYRSNKAGTGERFGYAVKHAFMARNRDGDLRFSVSRFVGGVGTSKLSRIWVPPSWKNWENVAISYGLWSVTEAGVNVSKEFVPDIIRALRGRKPKP